MNALYIVAYEAGAANTPVPTWASEVENPFDLQEDSPKNIERIDIPTVPGAFQLLNVLSMSECQRLIERTEKEGYTQEAAISLPRSVRHNDNFTWVADEKTHDIIWKRCAAFFHDREKVYENKKPLGLNKRFRFYKYGVGDFFRPHTDGSWPGSAIVNKKLITDVFRDRYSQMTFLIFLSEGYEGGATRFWVDRDDTSRPAKGLQNAKEVDIRTPRGGVLCFPHGVHPLHCLHSSEEIYKGTKYIIRTDVLFQK